MQFARNSVILQNNYCSFCDVGIRIVVFLLISFLHCNLDYIFYLATFGKRNYCIDMIRPMSTVDFRIYFRKRFNSFAFITCSSIVLDIIQFKHFVEKKKSLKRQRKCLGVYVCGSSQFCEIEPEWYDNKENSQLINLCLNGLRMSLCSLLQGLPLD